MRQRKLTIIGKIQARKVELYNKVKLSPKEKTELKEIEKQLSEMSMERKKNKDGLYDYYVADNNGKKIQNFAKSSTDMRQLGGGFYEYEYNLATYKYKIDGYTLIESSKPTKIINTIAKSIINNTSTEIFCGVKKVILYDHEKQHFLLELELLHFLMVMKDFDKKYDLPKKYDLDKQKLICVIDEKGKFIIKPTFKEIPVNYER